MKRPFFLVDIQSQRRRDHHDQWLRTDLHRKLDGTNSPMKGDPGITSVSVKIMGKNALEETDKRDGKVIAVFKMTVANDGKTAKASVDDKMQNRTTAFDVTKQ